MSLTIYFSSKIKNLAQKLKQDLMEERKRKNDPFQFSQVVVPNQQMERWLRIRVFADAPSLCAGMEFPFINARLKKLMMRNFPEQKTEKISDYGYAAAIIKILMEDPNKKLDPFRKYIDENASGIPSLDTPEKAGHGWQLAEKLALLMDVYEAHCPDMLERWIKGEPNKAEPGRFRSQMEETEAYLAQRLFADDGYFPDSESAQQSIRQIFYRVKDQEPSGEKETLILFGHSGLSEIHIRILFWLAQKHNVLFYHNNVCLEYWGDIEKVNTKRSGYLKDLWNDKISASQFENMLLQSWGIAGRETVRLLTELEEENGMSDNPVNYEQIVLDTEAGKEPKNVLQAVQSSIRNRNSGVNRLKQDSSLQIVGTKGIRREVEMVYNSIIGSVIPLKDGSHRPWPDCTLSDIAVLVPDMKTYRPMLEAVFDARKEIPYGLIDTTASESSCFLSGMIDLVHLHRNGLNRENLFQVLSNPLIASAMNYTQDDADEWRRITDDIGAFDFYDDRDAENHKVQPASYFTWQWALKRLRLGRVADTLPASDSDNTALPLEERVNNVSADKFVETVDLLYHELAEDFGDLSARPIADWFTAFHDLADAFLQMEQDNQLEQSVRIHLIGLLNELSLFEDIPLPFDFVFSAIQQFLGGISCQKGGYLTNGITIAGLRPMRPVPFKQVYILGLGEGGFPGRKNDSSLNLKGLGSRISDVAEPEENKYLFLETLMAVEDRLVLSYPNQDICKDAELFPSSIIRTLETFLSESVLTGDSVFKEIDFPLLERNISCVSDISWKQETYDSGILPTYSGAARRIAFRRLHPSKQERISACNSNDKSFGKTEKPGKKELSEFLQKPFESVLQYRFGISKESSRDKTISSDSPMEYGNLDLWEIQRKIVEGETNIDKIVLEIQKKGKIPVGYLGEYAKTEIRKIYTPDLISYVTGCIRDNFGIDGEKIPYAFGSASKNQQFPGKKLIEIWISLLESIENKDDMEKHTLQIGQIIFPTKSDDQKNPVMLWQWNITGKEAFDFLEKLRIAYQNYLDNSENQAFADVSYTDFADALKDCENAANRDEIAIDKRVCNKIREHVQTENPNSAKSYSDLTVQHIIDEYVVIPDDDELRNLFRCRYQLFMSGICQVISLKGDSVK